MLPKALKHQTIGYHSESSGPGVGKARPADGPAVSDASQAGETQGNPAAMRRNLRSGLYFLTVSSASAATVTSTGTPGLSATSWPFASFRVLSMRISRYRWSDPFTTIWAFSGSRGSRGLITFSTMPGKVVLGFSFGMIGFWLIVRAWETSKKL